MAPRRLLAVGMMGAMATLAACQLVAGYEGFGGGSGAAGAATAPRRCAPVPRSKSDPKDLGILDLVEPAEEDCFWADHTEVTVAQYRRFLAERAPATPFDAQMCPWKTAITDPFLPGDACAIEAQTKEKTLMVFADEQPIRCVDWCDAAAFCVWAGKTLCGGGHFGNLYVPSDGPAEWETACSRDHASLPYGTAAVVGRCNVGLSTGDCLKQQGHECAPVRAGSYQGCGEPLGPVDMIGNVSEWVFMCTAPNGGAPPGAELPCVQRGGSYADDLNAGTCLIKTSSTPRGDRRPTLGLRCCVSMTSGERASVSTGR